MADKITTIEDAISKIDQLEADVERLRYGLTKLANRDNYGVVQHETDKSLFLIAWLPSHDQQNTPSQFAQHLLDGGDAGNSDVDCSSCELVNCPAHPRHNGRGLFW